MSSLPLSHSDACNYRTHAHDLLLTKIQDGGRRRPGNGARKLSGKSVILLVSLSRPSDNNSVIDFLPEYNWNREPRRMYYPSGPP